MHGTMNVKQKEIIWPYKKVNIRPGLSGTAPEVKNVPN
jgi:hypothetical protein